MSFVCFQCGKKFEDDNTFVYDNHDYCDDCFHDNFSTCEDCRDIVSNDDVYYTANDRCICSDCFNRNYFICGRCGEVYDTDEMNEDLWGETVCSYCYEESCEHFGIHDHDYTPDDLTFYCDEDSNESNHRYVNPHIGIELEIQGEKRNDFCVEVNKQLDRFFYLKQDGSLSTKRGIEIVSHPMTYKFINNKIIFNELFDYLKKYGMNDTDNCGLHFHIDREYVAKTSSVATIDYIVNHFSEYFERIGGRSITPDADWCRKVVKTNENWGTRTYSRYCAVNLENSDTIELRFCKSTNDYDTFMNRVKMVFAIIYFANKYTVNEIMSWTKTKFTRRFNLIMRMEF